LCCRATVSRYHARIEHQPGGLFYIVDVGSTNGVWSMKKNSKLISAAILTSEQGGSLGDYWAKLEQWAGVAVPRLLPGLATAGEPGGSGD